MDIKKFMEVEKTSFQIIKFYIDFFMNKTKSEDGVEMNANMDSFSMNEDLLSEANTAEFENRCN
jgi:hypothetical protein